MDYFPELAPGTTVAYNAVLNRVERIYKPKKLSDVTTPLLADYISEMRKESYPETTVAKHVRQLLALLRWAQKQNLLTLVPEKPAAPRGRGRRIGKPKGRAVGEEEFSAMLKAVPRVLQGTMIEQFVRLLIGLRMSGLRLSDAMAARWDSDADVYPLITEGQYPVWAFSDKQKNRKAQHGPMTPECADFLMATPPEARRGFLFPLEGRSGRLTLGTVSKYPSKIGKEAGVVVADASLRTGNIKHASAHDLRRTFAQALAYHVPASVLQVAMRHQSPVTTSTYYLSDDAQAAARIMWAGSHRRSP